MKVIIAAAGTAGHINPGIAIANKIKEEQKDSKIIFIGTTRGLENDLVPRAGYELKTIDAYGLSKKISVENFKKMYKTFKGYGEAKKIIEEFKPDIVIGTGGYICGATISSANKLGIPTLIHESNAFPGKAVKLLAKRTDTVLVSFKDAIDRIKKAKNVVYTGTPIEPQGLSLKQEIASDSVGGGGSADIHLSPDGRFLYASNRLKEDGISTFEVAEGGELRKIDYTHTGRHPRNFTLTPAGDYLLVAVRDDDRIEVFRRDAATGVLTATGVTLDISRPVCLVWR